MASSSEDDKEGRTKQLYMRLMAEVKLRTEVIDRCTVPPIAKPLFGDEAFAVEFTMLQLRMICELIALACVVAHDDIALTRGPKLRKDYSAYRIFGKLARYHPDFFPRPVTITQSTPHTGNLTPVSEGCISREELEDLYHYCHEMLHRGRVHQVLDGEIREYRFRDMYAATNKIANLLRVHVIKLARPDEDYLLRMEGPTGKLQMETVLPRVPDKDR
jgi:hypothetical protein